MPTGVNLAFVGQERLESFRGQEVLPSTDGRVGRGCGALLPLQSGIVCQGWLGSAVLVQNLVGGRLLRPMLHVIY